VIAQDLEVHLTVSGPDHADVADARPRASEKSLGACELVHSLPCTKRCECWF
jgi:hypothetical protein